MTKHAKLLSLNQPKVLNAWAMFDWANSAYNLVITSTIFPIYYNNVTKNAFQGDVVSFFGISVVNTVLYSYAISFSFLVIAILSPLLSGVADYSGRKKFFMKLFTYLGGGACISLYFFDGYNVEYGIIGAILASIGYSGGLVFYNAFLPEIASEDRYDFISARGFSLGYIGSVLLLIFNLYMISNPEVFGLDDASMASKVSFLLVGIWWIGFSQISFYFLPSNVHNKQDGEAIFRKGYLELISVWHKIKKLPHLKTFLISFFFYSTGVQTVMFLATSFGVKELDLASDKLIMTILIIQLVAILGSYFFAYVSKIRGNKFSLFFMVLIWIGICIGAYFTTNEYQFYGLAFVVGMVMGGIQSLSRSTYSKLIPANTTDTASFFSFFDVSEKVAIVLGTFCYGLIEQLTGSMRNSAVALAIFFVLGIFFLSYVKIPDIRKEL
jgi:MFS transporter, UMF1 family